MLSPGISQYFYRNRAIFTNTIWNLLVVLSKWKRRSHGELEHRLVLDLGVYSPSDSQHAFRDFRLEDDYPYLVKEDLDETFEAYHLAYGEPTRETKFPTGCPTWVVACREAPSYRSRLRVTGTQPLKLNFRDIEEGPLRFPRVKAVKELVVRRQYYRDIAPGVFSKLLKESFTSLQKFRYELWENVEAAFQHWYMEGILNQISYS